MHLKGVADAPDDESVFVVDLFKVLVIHLDEAVSLEVLHVQEGNFLLAKLLLHTQGLFELLTEDFGADHRPLWTDFLPL